LYIDTMCCDDIYSCLRLAFLPWRGVTLRATQPATIQATILTAGILTDEAVRSGTLAKAGEKRKERDEASKSEIVGKDEKKAKGE
ncbi:hypothetical protein Tco_0430657, partial [Tanacetum coccineum]